MTDAERLTALDAAFLDLESENALMNIGAIAVFDAGPLRLAHGGIDFESVRAAIEAALDRVPRYRQRIVRVPVLGQPVWVDDERFNLRYHVRHTALPRPGDDRQLRRMAARVFSQKLDRSRPLWEMWVVEGLEGDRFAIVAKAHHCLADGVAGVGVITSLLRFGPDAVRPAPSAWSPTARPGGLALLRSELRHRTRGPAALIAAAQRLRSSPRETLQRAGATARGLVDTLRTGLRPADATPLNPRLSSSFRRFDGAALSLDEVKEVKNSLGGKVNDVALATAVGALRRFLDRRGVAVERLADFRALIPVDTGGRTRGAGLGNRVALMIAELPLSEADPAQRYRRVCEGMAFLKEQSQQKQSAELIEEVGDMTSSHLVSELFQAAARLRSYNVVITNVPGPPVPLYLLGARLREVYPLVPLFANQALGLALISYAGTLFWGLNAEWEAMPDLHELVGDLHAAFDELLALARATGQEHTELPASAGGAS
jgi:WS/DGAT/MGAT family acyltransferase